MEHVRKPGLKFYNYFSLYASNFKMIFKKNVKSVCDIQVKTAVY